MIMSHTDSTDFTESTSLTLVPVGHAECFRSGWQHTSDSEVCSVKSVESV